MIDVSKTLVELNSQIMGAMEGDLKKEADEDTALRT